VNSQATEVPLHALPTPDYTDPHVREALFDIIDEALANGTISEAVANSARGRAQDCRRNPGRAENDRRQAEVVDQLDSGEQQPRLPSAEAVRDQNIPRLNSTRRSRCRRRRRSRAARRKKPRPRSAKRSRKRSNFEVRGIDGKKKANITVAEDRKDARAVIESERAKNKAERAKLIAELKAKVLDVSRAIHKWCASRAHTMAVGTDRRRTFSQARLGRAILVAIDQHYAAQGVKEMWLRVQNHLQSTVSPEDSGRDGPDIFARRPCLDAIIRANTIRQ